MPKAAVEEKLKEEQEAVAEEVAEKPTGHVIDFKYGPEQGVRLDTCKKGGYLTGVVDEIKRVTLSGGPRNKYVVLLDEGQNDPFARKTIEVSELDDRPLDDRPGKTPIGTSPFIIGPEDPSDAGIPTPHEFKFDLGDAVWIEDQTLESNFPKEKADKGKPPVMAPFIARVTQMIVYVAAPDVYKNRYRVQWRRTTAADPSQEYTIDKDPRARIIEEADLESAKTKVKAPAKRRRRRRPARETATAE